MKIAILLHGAAVMRAPQPLHDADRGLVGLCRRLGAESTVVELCGTPGLLPQAINEASALGIDWPIRIVSEALDTADAHSTGLVAERILRGVNADLVLFSAAADPEGLADVPAVIALRLAAAYVPDVHELSRAAARENDTASPSAFDVVADRAGVRVILEIPRGAVLGVEGAATFGDASSAPATPSAPHASATVSASPPLSAAPPRIRIVTLPDLGLESTLVRRRNDLRGVIEATSRPLVTTRSVASLVALLR
jgi:hypothetical protein